MADFDVPLVRATWFIKMTAAYHLTQTNAKMKKRAANDSKSNNKLYILECGKVLNAIF